MNDYTISLKAARVNANLTLEKAAKKIGIAKETLSSWENGKTYPKANQLDAILIVYGVPKDALRL